MAAPDAQHSTRRIPEFASREEMAEFWDTHDISDYWDELDPVEVDFGTPTSRTLALQLDIGTWEEVEALARDRDLPPDRLLHAWILERRDAERNGSGAAIPDESDDRPFVGTPPVAPRAGAGSGDDR